MIKCIDMVSKNVMRFFCKVRAQSRDRKAESWWIEGEETGAWYMDT